jgi:phage terminase large subunit
MRRKFILLALNYAGLKLLLLRRTLPELRENHVIPLIGELYGTATYKDSEKAFVFPNGSRIKLGYCDNEADIYQYQGQEYDVIGMEEATHFSNDMRIFFTTCNRSTRTDFKPRMYYTSNPGGVGHTWFKRLFIDREYQNKEREEDYVFIPAQIYDNTVLMESNPEYIEALENLPEDMRRAHLYGDWNVWAGQMFSEFRTERHVIEPFDIPASWKRFRSIDFGYNDHTAVYWYAMHDQHIYCYRELHIRQTLASDLAKMIVDMSKGEDIAYTTASPDMWQKRGMGIYKDPTIGESIAETFDRNGVPLQQADNSRIIGWQRVHEFLKDAPDGRPFLLFFNGCKNIIKHLPQLCYDEHKPEDAATEPHDITDTCDSLRYGLMSRPRPTEPMTAFETKHWSSDMWADYNRADKASRIILLRKWGKQA